MTHSTGTASTIDHPAPAGSSVPAVLRAVQVISVLAVLNLVSSTSPPGRSSRGVGPSWACTPPGRSCSTS